MSEESTTSRLGILQVTTDFSAAEALELQQPYVNLFGLNEDPTDVEDDGDGLQSEPSEDDPDLPACKRHKPLNPTEPKRRHRKAAKRAAQKTKARALRKEERETARAASGSTLKQIAIKKGKKSINGAAKVNLPPEKVRVVTTGWTGVRRGQTCKTEHSLESAKKAGLEVFDWDAKETVAFALNDDRIIAILVAIPDDDNYQNDLAEGTSAVHEAGSKIHFTMKERNNHRGTSPACAKGISHGGGQETPKVLSHSKSTDTILDNLCSLSFFNRVSGLANHNLRFYAPRAHEFQKNGLEDLLEHYSELKPNFSDTAFAACTWNFGPHFVSYPHLDSSNSAFTWCAITAMGDFDPDRGGHLILWDLGLIVRFPPGATILIPSALLIHSNVAVQKGETRYSFVQYTAGALFRWVKQGFQTQEAWEKTATPEMKAQKMREDSERVANGLKMFSTSAELLENYRTKQSVSL